MKSYRDQGALGALLDEYEKAIHELSDVLSEIDTEELHRIVDYTTQDSDCVSIQTILSHVIQAGYNYTIAIENHYFNANKDYSSMVTFDCIREYQSALKQMFMYQAHIFDLNPKIQLEQKDPNLKMVVSWGQSYDIEQLIEHAIVHILRHRRQIERFVIKLRN